MTAKIVKPNKKLINRQTEQLENRRLLDRGTFFPATDLGFHLGEEVFENKSANRVHT